MLEELFDGLVGVEQTNLQIEHRLPSDTKTKMTGLDDASMDRTHRRLEYPFALHRPEEIDRKSVV